MKEKQYIINQFESIHDIYAVNEVFTHSEIVKKLTTLIPAPNKDVAPLFKPVEFDESASAETAINKQGIRYKTKGLSNAQFLHLFVLEFDNKPLHPGIEMFQESRQSFVTFNQIAKIFQDYEYVIYPTFSNKLKKYIWALKDEKVKEPSWCDVKVPYGEGVEKFRIVFFLDEKISKNDFQNIDFDEIKQFQEVIKFADPIFNRMTQPNYFAAINNFEVQKAIYNTGKLLNLEEFFGKKEALKSEILNDDKFTTTKTLKEKLKNSRKEVTLFDLFQNAGMIKNNDNSRGGWITVQCPWNASHSTGDGEAGIKLREDGTWIFSCFHGSHGKKTTGDAFRFFKNENDISKVKKELPTKYKKKYVKKSEALLEFDELEEQFENIILDDTNNERSKKIICGTHGIGKTQIIHKLLKNGKKIVFTAPTYNQLREKFEEFKNAGYKCIMVKSKQNKLEENYEVILQEEKEAFDAPLIDRKATYKSIAKIEKLDIKRDLKRIRKIFNDTKGDVLPQNFKNIDIIFIVNNRLIQQHLNFEEKNVVVFVDDVTIQDIQLFKRAKAHYKRLGETRTVDDVVYCVRPLLKRIGQHVNYPMYFTTAERNIAEQLYQQLNKNHRKIYYLNVEIPFHNNIFYFKTDLVLKKHIDELETLFKKIKEKCEDEAVIVGDACQNVDFKMNSLKGFNSLINKTIVIKGSRLNVEYLHDRFAQRLKILSMEEKKEFEGQIWLENIEQIIARNSGRRFSGGLCFVLIPKNMEETILKSQYKMINLEDANLNENWMFREIKNIIFR